MSLEITYRGHRARLMCSGAYTERPRSGIDPETPAEYLALYLDNRWRRIDLNIIRALREGRIDEALRKLIDKEIAMMHELKAAQMDALPTVDMGFW
ncbi:MAG: hypothetical protein KGJ62_14975 [Armatimonadetes bacterium]|nr:hypothetical protein [Armatimonadota bacterium]MDE2206160.1 hypothetical protein [Armatimonadota bacterium]